MHRSRLPPAPRRPRTPPTSAPRPSQMRSPHPGRCPAPRAPARHGGPRSERLRVTVEGHPRAPAHQEAARRRAGSGAAPGERERPSQGSGLGPGSRKRRKPEPLGPPRPLQRGAYSPVSAGLGFRPTGRPHRGWEGRAEEKPLLQILGRKAEPGGKVEPRGRRSSGGAVPQPGALSTPPSRLPA